MRRAAKRQRRSRKTRRNSAIRCSNSEREEVRCATLPHEAPPAKFLCETILAVSRPACQQAVPAASGAGYRGGEDHLFGAPNANATLTSKTRLRAGAR